MTVGIRPDGTPISVGGTADTEAQAERAKILALADHLRGGVATPDRITVGEWLDRWLEGKRPRLAVKTHHNYEQLIERHVKPHLGRRRLQSLKPVDLHALYGALTARGLRDTQRQVHNILHAAFETAVRLDLITRNPSTVVRPSPPRREHGDWSAEEGAKALTADEVARLLPVLRRDRWGLVFEFLLATGLRRAEVCGLRWEDVDLDRGILRFRHNLVTVAGKPVLGPPKTASRARPLRLSPQALDCLRRQAETQALERAALAPGRVAGHPKTYVRKRVWEDTGYVFTALFGGRLHPDRLRGHLTRFSREAGIRAVTNHGLRHTHASLMLRKGAPLEVVSKKLGHARPSFTADVYRHVYDDELEEWALDLDELIGKSSE
ncbi:site-specific integrase [uncultured Deinococcus sp.]|uniref:tyrosine-type recombinase/integrase n=1 Tax=uncultured Deinococcus sp. TaxID=158789 RepID=UPI00258CF58F|nr:site-specific integrase [uncultured Deinococcus sp.]